MFCPKCATQNVDGASYCRACGANISLIPQALTGQLPPARTTRDDLNDLKIGIRRRQGRNRKPRDYEPSVERGIVSLCAGLGFLVAALAVMFKFPGGIFWGWCFFFPAFSAIGKGIASIVAASRNQAAQLPPSAVDSAGVFPTNVPQSFTAQPSLGTRRLNTNELAPSVPSVTEGTTRHLGVEAATKHFEEETEDQTTH